MEVLMGVIDGLYRYMQRFGPLLLVEILLPGGTLVAFVLFYYHRRREREHMQRVRHGQQPSSTIGRMLPVVAALNPCSIDRKPFS